MADRRHPNVVNVAELEPRELAVGTKFGSRARSLAAAAGGKGIGATWHEVAPGRAAYPAHWHAVKEEAIFVLEGEGDLRLGERTLRIGPGDWVSIRPGPEGAHKLVATGTAPLRYLALSTGEPTDVVGYPDSGKLGILAAPSYQEAMAGKSWVRQLVKQGESLDYFDGEDVG